MREIITDAIRYWEPRRIAYNVVLAAIVCGYFASNLPASKATLSIDGVLTLFLLAVLANGCYCAAYVADVFAQYSAFRTTWIERRWVLFALGLAIAAIMTRFFALGFFAAQVAQPISQ
ncbi:MAG: hypothetical protein RL088_3956 [Verrucomicrobiota bacterium]